MNIQSYYQQEAQNQINAELDFAMRMDHREELINEDKYWAKVDADEYERETDNHARAIN